MSPVCRIISLPDRTVCDLQDMAQRILDLESELARSRAEISKGIPRNTEFSKGNVEDGAAEEKDWILEASHG